MSQAPQKGNSQPPAPICPQQGKEACLLQQQRFPETYLYKERKWHSFLIHLLPKSNSRVRTFFRSQTNNQQQPINFKRNSEGKSKCSHTSCFEENKVKTLLAHMDTVLQFPGHRRCLGSALPEQIFFFLLRLRVLESKMINWKQQISTQERRKENTTLSEEGLSNTRQSLSQREPREDTSPSILRENILQSTRPCLRSSETALYNLTLHLSLMLPQQAILWVQPKSLQSLSAQTQFTQFTDN